MTIERTAWAALQTALPSSHFSCAGDDCFTGDARGGTQTDDLAICADCPIRRECHDYAVSLRYRASGFWAGRWRGKYVIESDDLAV